MGSLAYGVVLLPDEQLANQAIYASQKLAQLGGLFTLEIGKFFPHVSLIC